MLRVILIACVVSLLSLLSFLEADPSRTQRVAAQLAGGPASEAVASADRESIAAGRFVVRGTLTGRGTGALAEAWVVATQGTKRELTLTDGAGGYEAVLPARGEWTLTFEAEGHVTASHPVAVEGAVALDVTLVPLARLTGTVQAAGGVPAGLAVQAVSTGDESTIHRGAASGDGCFSFLVEPGTYELHLVASGYHWPPQRRVAVAPGGEAVVTLTLAARGGLRGEVVLPETDCTLVRIDATHAETRQARALGVNPAHTRSFALDDLEPGPWIVEATLKPGGQRFTAAVAVAAGQRSHVTLGGTQATLAGFLEPAGAATVRVHAFLDARVVDSTAALTATAGTDGRFEFRAVEPGPYVVVVERGDAVASVRVDVAPHTTTTVRPRLARVQRSLRVLDGGRALAGKSVQLILQPHQRVRRWVRTDEEGVAVTTGLPPGRYLVRRGRRATFVQLDGHADAVLPAK